MEESYDIGVVSGVVTYMILVALMVLGGVGFWVGYRVFGAGLVIGTAGLLAWMVFGQAGM